MMSASSEEGASGGSGSNSGESGTSAGGGDPDIDPNKLRHIFENPEHNLAGVVERFGSQENAFAVLQQATQETVDSQGLQGLFRITVDLGGQNVTVTGKVIQGIARIGTAYVP